ncbi:zinc finger ccch domain protein-related [Anaeramoeba flamelloides]|uniref:Zinc finger ccch domain protein-related n=1 Tax=Anaeramoeba flamelloides TaxID=1746091 RepID=A0ABQ8XX10_9EUKA|nr:zinc finger ccch domain protein-related [Anaeramoeba flamelloides]
MYNKESSENATIYFGSKTIVYNKFDPRLYTVPCKYWSLGTCKMGEQCRFLHGKELSDDPRRPEYTGPPVYISDGKYQQISMNNSNQNYGENSDSSFYPNNYNNVNSTSFQQPLKTQQLNSNQNIYSSQTGYYEQKNLSTFNEFNQNGNQISKNAKKENMKERNRESMKERNKESMKERNKENISSQNERFKLTPDETQLEQLICRYRRKPYLELAVLYSNDKTVTKYSNLVRRAFLDNGIDVYLKLETSFGNIIKTENLSKIISQSIADFFVVLGDRNLKNQTCQVRKKGKLIEMDTFQVIGKIWYDWKKSFEICDCKFGFKLSSNNNNNTQTNNLLGSGYQNEQQFTRKELFKILARHTNLGDIESKITKLTNLFSTFLEYSKTNQNIENNNSESLISESILLKMQKSIELFRNSLLISKQMIYQIKIEKPNSKKPLRSQRGNIVTASYIPKNKTPRIPIRLKKELLEVIKQAFEILIKVEKGISSYREKIKLQGQRMNFQNQSQKNNINNFTNNKQNEIQINIEKYSQNSGILNDNNSFENNSGNSNNSDNSNNSGNDQNNTDNRENVLNTLKQQFNDFLNVIDEIKLGFTENMEHQFEKQQKYIQKKRLDSFQKLNNIRNSSILRVSSQPSFTFQRNQNNMVNMLGNLSTGNISGIQQKSNQLKTSISMESLHSKLFKK